MTGRRLLLKKLTEAVLAGDGALPLKALLEAAVPVSDLRALTRKFSLSPKGFRVEKAPAKVLAPLLADRREADELEEVLDTLLSRLAARDEQLPAADPPAPRSLEPLLQLREQELAQARQRLEKAQKAQARARERAEELERRLRESAEQVAHLRRALTDETRRRPSTEQSGGDRKLLTRTRELERDLEALSESEQGLRRLLALRTTRIRMLEEQLAELNDLLPKGRRRKKKPLPPPQEEPEGPFALPHFTPAFYKSLEGKDRKSVEKAFQAVLLYCTEGPAYPGIEAKQMGGQDTWSLRAGLRHRVYFKPREDGDITVLAMADREDQHTTLRRLKER